MIAALYVQAGGAYYGIPDVDPWDETRDARLYQGPWPVVAHPPCARWCRLARLVEFFAAAGAAGAAVQAHGGVLEHPAWSIAWGAHGLIAPPARGWAREAFGPGWVCEVSQAAYGHRAPKATWLYYVGTAPPLPLDWSRPAGQATVTRPCAEGPPVTLADAYRRLPPRALALLHLRAVVRRARRYSRDGMPLPVAVTVADRILRGESRAPR